jgi:hypothetical protein
MTSRTVSSVRCQLDFTHGIIKWCQLALSLNGPNVFLFLLLLLLSASSCLINELRPDATSVPAETKERWNEIEEAISTATATSEVSYYDIPGCLIILVLHDDQCVANVSRRPCSH